MIIRNYFLTVSFFYYLVEMTNEQRYLTGKLIELVDGSKLFLYNGYTYHKRNWTKKVGAWRWKCSCMKCRSFLCLDEQMTIFQSHIDHNHEPATLYMTKTGKYVKLRDVAKSE